TFIGSGLLFLGVAVLAACTKSPEQATDANATVNRLADRHVAAVLEREPGIAYFTGLTAPAHDYLTDNSLAALAEWQAFEDVLYAELEQVFLVVFVLCVWMEWWSLFVAFEVLMVQRVFLSVL